jgi:heme-degrading monooxygenase HmoA
MKKKILLLALAILAASCATTHPAASRQTAHVARVWRGEVPAARADEYEKYLTAEGVKKLRAIPANLGVEMFRRTVGDREEFIVISYWPTEDSIRAWAGENVTTTRLLPRDREFLIDPELQVRHYTIAVEEHE